MIYDSGFVIVEERSAFLEQICLKVKMSMNATHERFVCPDEFNAVDTCSWQFITTTGELSLMAISIFFRNAVVILAATMFKKLLRSVSNLFTLSLAVTDLLLADLVLLLAITNQVLGYWIF